MSGSRREALPGVQEWSGGSPGCPGVVVRSSWKSGSGREALRDVRNGREDLPDVRNWSVGPPLCPVEVGRAFVMSGSGRKVVR